MTTPSPAPQHAINAAIEAHSKLADNRLPTEFIPPLAAIITKHAAALSEENLALKREVEEARSAMRARDNIGMSREEYHKAKKALEENETLRVHLASERQAKIERGDMFIELQAQYAAAQSELAELRKDRERIEWLEDGHNTVVWNDRAGGFTIQKCQQVVGNIGVGRALRAAIDAAMQSQEKAPGDDREGRK